MGTRRNREGQGDGEMRRWRIKATAGSAGGERERTFCLLAEDNLSSLFSRLTRVI